MQAAASSVLPGTESGNLTLSDLALDAAIEIEKFESAGTASFVALKQLGQSLARSTNGDLTLVPVYDRALAVSSDNHHATSKSGSRFLLGTSRRSDTVTRTKVLERYASEKLGITIPGYANAFVSEAPKRSAADIFMIEIADSVVVDMPFSTFCSSRPNSKDGRRSATTHSTTSAAARPFEMGVPFDEEATIGDLVNAAWRIF
jgi:hypothetical protein